MAGERLTFGIMLGGLVAAGAGVGALIALFSGGLPNNEPVELENPPAETSEADPNNPYSEFQMAEFDLLDHEGRPVTQALLDNRVTLVSFFFASCPGPCPIISAKMAELQRATEGTELRLLSISVDGLRDTPEVIKNYAAGYQADLDRWAFLTGHPEVVEGLLNESLAYQIRRQANEPVVAVDGSTIANILHPTRILLVGPDRRLLTAPVNATDTEGVNEMMSIALEAAAD